MACDKPDYQNDAIAALDIHDRNAAAGIDFDSITGGNRERDLRSILL